MSSVQEFERQYVEIRRKLLQEERGKNGEKYGRRAWVLLTLEPAKEGAHFRGDEKREARIPDHYLSDELDPDGLLRSTYEAWNRWQGALHP